MYFALLILLSINTSACNRLTQQHSLMREYQTKNDGTAKKDETKAAKASCSLVFTNSKKGISSETSLTLFLTKNGNVYTTGVRGNQKNKDEIVKYIMTNSDKLFPNKPIEVVLVVQDIVTIEILKQFVDNLSNGLPEHKSVVLYVELYGDKTEK